VQNWTGVSNVSDYGEFLEEEFTNFCAKGFWMLLPYDDVRDLPQHPEYGAPGAMSTIVDCCVFGVGKSNENATSQASLQLITSDLFATTASCYLLDCL
jgi:hypothetical protein